MMKRVFALLLLFALLLCGCGKENDTTATEPDAAAVPTATEAPAQTELPVETSSPVAAGHEMSALAMEDFMLPLEEHSWDREYDPEFVMLHFTSAVVNNRRDPYNIAAIREIFYGYDVSIHYIIERDGTIRCYIPEDRVAWHAGAGTYGNDEKYTDKMNLYAIGIELVAIGSQEDMADYLTPEEYAALDDDLIGFTEEQYVALEALVADICQRNNIPQDRDHVIGHSDFTQDNGDPGSMFDWSRVIP